MPNPSEVVANAVWLLRDGCWGIPRCMVGAPAKDCEPCAAADALESLAGRTGRDSEPILIGELTLDQAEARFATSSPYGKQELFHAAINALRAARPTPEEPAQ